MSDATICFIVALRNNSGGLAATLESFATQAESASLEVLILDCNSTDDPWRVVEDFSGRLRIKFQSQYDAGIYCAWNKALPLVQSPWLSFFGSGDTLLPGAMSSLLKCIAEDDGYDLIVSRTLNRFPDGTGKVSGRPFRYEEFRQYFSVNHSGALYRSTVFSRYGNFNERYSICADYEFLLRVCRKVRIGYLDVVVSEYLYGGISSNSLEPLKQAFAIRSKAASVSRARNIFLFLRGALSLLRRKYFWRAVSWS